MEKHLPAEPVKLTPVRKEYLWGTEDWMLSYLHEGFEEIPLLVKIITSHEALSVQVHPGDAYAREEEGKNGKTEMWYVLDCEPGAYLYYGLKHKISANEFLKRIQNQTILEVCRKMPVKKGDVFYIPAGLLHAIGAGITVAEIQQSSNLTYRVYDYNREDANHQKRPLHIEKAAQVAGFMPPLQGHRPMGLRQQREGYFKTLLVQCPYFTTHLYEIETEAKLSAEKGFQSLLVLEGEGRLESAMGKLDIAAGDSLYVPKEAGAYRIDGTMQILISEE